MGGILQGRGESRGDTRIEGSVMNKRITILVLSAVACGAGVLAGHAVGEERGGRGPMIPAGGRALDRMATIARGRVNFIPVN
jgi:hypothetical protein